MSESKMVTEREAVIRERWAFVKGSQFEDEAWREMLRVNHSSGADCIAASQRLYPLPMVERPRRVTDPHSGLIFWTTTIARIDSGSGRVVSLASDGRFGGEFRDMDVTPARMAVWADLLANPTELVEDTP